MNHRRTVGGLLLILAVAVACDDGTDAGVQTTAPTPASSTADPLASPTIDGLYEVDDEGRQLHLKCWGEGSPTVVLEAGHPHGAGIFDFGERGAPSLAPSPRRLGYVPMAEPVGMEAIRLLTSRAQPTMSSTISTTCSARPKLLGRMSWLARRLVAW